MKYVYYKNETNNKVFKGELIAIVSYREILVKTEVDYTHIIVNADKVIAEKLGQEIFEANRQLNSLLSKAFRN